MEEHKLGSLFDGSGGFPLAGHDCGVETAWMSEIEPYPIAVTKNIFTSAKHLGDISKINGAEIEPVDIITFGSPCQDLSVAGKRAGLKHEANGDDETTRSGLFMEAVRIIKEMRDATNGKYPRFALWENVPGAFSSNKGEDFRIVCEELIKIVEPCAVMPAVPKRGWAYADSYCGDGWSLAYRVFDAQYWGVPQRRRRIHLVLDLGGECAAEVLFEREGLRGHLAESGTPWETASRNAESGIGAADREGKIRNLNKGDTVPVTYDARGNGDGNTVSTLTGDHENRITDYTSIVCMATQQGGAEIRTDDKAPTITAAAGMSGNNQPVICLQGNGIDRADTAGCNGKGWREDQCYTLNTIDRPAVCYQDSVGALCARDYKGVGSQYVSEDKLIIEQKPQYIVRRLTPTECARLQGFPDLWGHFPEKNDFTDEEYRFWLDVRNTHADINGKAEKYYTKNQMLTWYNKLHTDSAEYKMWGNGIALPPAIYCMQGIVEVLNERKGKNEQS